MQKLIRKEQALFITFLTGLIILNPAAADDKKSKELIDIERSEELEKISIKNINKLGDKEFSYQNKDNNIILVKCDSNKILVRYWYFTKIEDIKPNQATSMMQWHRAKPQSQTQLKSVFVCNYD